MSAPRDTTTAGSSNARDRNLKRATSDSPPPSKKPKMTSKDVCKHLDPPSLQLTFHKGDMFADAPKGCVLIHACNTQGHWGAGIAKAFKQRYPNAYAEHHRFCAKDHSKAHPLETGTAQLLAPRDGDKQHWIGCVFTSAKYGKGKDKADVIIRNTGKSMQMLLELISQVDGEVTGIRMCKINSGKFGVPWERTEEVLHDMTLQPHWRTMIEVWGPGE